VFYYPDITIKPCHFHFSQNIHKKVVEICLKVEYGENEELKTWVKKLTALALIPPVRDAIQRLIYFQ
jgi:hypothetical protein